MRLSSAQGCAAGIWSKSLGIISLRSARTAGSEQMVHLQVSPEGPGHHRICTFCPGHQRPAEEDQRVPEEQG